jgi:hypothetical protein
MDQFLDLIESIRAEEATAERIFAGEGTGVRSVKKDQAYLSRLALFAEVFADAVSHGSNRATYLLREAMATSDFPLMFADVIDRSMLANYREWPASYQNFAARKVVRDFRDVKEFTLDGGESVLAAVAQGAEYPGASLTEGKYQWAVQKYGRTMGFLWEAMINDDLDALSDIPARFARAARRTEQRFVTTLYVDANGPHASFYSAGNANIINTTNGASADNPPLSIGGLQDGLIVLSKQVDADGEPIVIDSVELVVPPALEVTAQNILNAIQLEAGGAGTAGGGGTAGIRLVTANWMKSRMRLNVDPYIPLVAASANGNRMWALFANPQTSRPALRYGLLRGHEEPETFLRSPNAIRVGGGDASPTDGSFENDSMAYKVRHVFGGSRIDPKATVASNGSAT